MEIKDFGLSKNSIICWWSGGITSAVACKQAIDLFGLSNCFFFFIDTKNEHEDTYRFKNDCEKWYQKKIHSISCIPEKYENIQQVWEKYLSLNIAGKGAVCSSELKRKVSEQFRKQNKIFKHQIFGFHIGEIGRAKAMALNNGFLSPVFPLLLYAFGKRDCLHFLQQNNITIPIPYQEGYENNNCYQTGCVQGGIGYWQKIQREEPDKFERMAQMEHFLTDKKGTPVTILRDKKTKLPLFLKKHPKYSFADISSKKGRPPKPLLECHGFCNLDDLSVKKNETYDELNLESLEDSNNITLF